MNTLDVIGWMLFAWCLGAIASYEFWRRIHKKVAIAHESYREFCDRHIAEMRREVDDLQVRQERRYVELKKRLGIWSPPS